MPLRFMQVFLPEEPGEAVDALLEGREVLGLWRDDGGRKGLAVHLLVPAEETEPIMDRFEQSYAQVEGFRVVLLPVEAVLPRAPEPNGRDGPAGEGQESVRETVKEPGRISREELYFDVVESLGINRVFVAMTVLSVVVAAAGLLRNDVAVVIGAMVIAPLLGPNVGMSLAATLGDLDLLRRALLANLVGLGLALLVSVAVGLVVAVDPAVPALATRTRVSFGDLALALAAGSAGTFAYTRGMAGAVIGVMVAVALVPPLASCGMLLGAGHMAAATGAILLVAANVVCINLAGVVTFIAQGIRPRTWWEAKRASRAVRTAVLIWCVLLVVLVAIIVVAQLE